MPEPATLFDDWSGRGRAAHEQDMTIEHTLTARDLKLVPPKNLTVEQRAVWDAFYDPRNAEFRDANLTGRDLVRQLQQGLLVEDRELISELVAMMASGIPMTVMAAMTMATDTSTI